MAAKDTVGRWGEDVAARHLVAAGLVILDRNWRCSAGEIDIVARDGRTLVFCEVKALVSRPGGPSAGPASPLEAVGPAKRAQVRRVARAWLAARGGAAASDLRFDVIGVILSPLGDVLALEHVEGAF